MVSRSYEGEEPESTPFWSKRIKEWFFLNDLKNFTCSVFDVEWIQRWIDLKSLGWNPWDTDKYQKRRWCHIRGIQKMNEYHTMKLKQMHDQQEREIKKQQREQRLRKAPSFSKEFTKISYADEDMNRLATENKGSTNSYSYQ